MKLFKVRKWSWIKKVLIRSNLIDFSSWFWTIVAFNGCLVVWLCVVLSEDNCPTFWACMFKEWHIGFNNSCKWVFPFTLPPHDCAHLFVIIAKKIYLNSHFSLYAHFSLTLSSFSNLKLSLSLSLNCSSSSSSLFLSQWLNNNLEWLNNLRRLLNNNTSLKIDQRLLSNNWFNNSFNNCN